MGITVHDIKLCMGSSCYSRGNGINAEYIQKAIADGSLTAKAGSVQLSGTLCEGRCREGPIVSIDGVVYTGVTVTVLRDLLSSLR